MLLSLVVWVGGIIFFAFVLAPTVFSVLPSRHLAGSVVNRALPALHWMGLVAGLVYLGSSIAYNFQITGEARAMSVRHLLILLMLLLTLISQFGIGSRMQALRNDMGQIDTIAQDDPRRVEFNRLHIWSTRLESGVLLMGLAAVVLTARKLV